MAIERLAFALLGVAALVVGPGLVAGESARPGTPAPEIGGASWINSGPLTMAGLRGRVVLVEFWTYG